MTKRDGSIQTGDQMGRWHLSASAA